MSRLRKTLGQAELLVTRPGGYVLQLEPEQLDTHRFERLLERGRLANAEGDPVAAAAVLHEALALWRGDALADFTYQSFARPEIERLEELRLTALEERIDAELALGKHRAIVPELTVLTGSHPLRERLRGQLMLALYRSGRQTEALRVYADTRRRLIEQLGLEPDQTLQQLEREILRQDPTLDLAAPGAGATKDRRRLLFAGIALALVAGAAAAGVLLAHGGTPNSRAESRAAPDSVALVSAGTGAIVGQVAAVRDPVLSRFGAGALWNVTATGQLTKIDPATGEVLASLNTGVPVPCGLAVGAGSVWVTDCGSPTLVRIDPAQGVVAGRIALPKDRDISGTDTGEVAVGAGSVWVAQGFANPSWVERLDPETGRVQKHILIPQGGAQRLAFGDGALWVAGDVDVPGPPKLSRIDPVTTKVTPALANFRGAFCCLAVGGGFVWGATSGDHRIWQIAEDGTVGSYIQLLADAQNLAYADGAVWAADGDAGSVVRIDPTTGATRMYRLGHDLQGVAVRKGMIAVGVQSSGPDVTANLKGRVVRIALASDALDWGSSGTDPVGTIIAFDQWQTQYQYATCAKLLNYPDAPGAAGRKLVPEVAAAWPAVTDGGRTYTFRIRRGFGFSPPSHEAVTAESFRHETERLLTNAGPRLSLFSSIVGANAFAAGKTAHISGVSARGDTLVIRLVRPTPDLPRLLALPWFCAVPADLPTVGLPYPIPTAGPYYLAARSTDIVVLKPNPNYHGSRLHRLDAIVYRFNVDVAHAVGAVAKGTVDYVEENDPALAPKTAAVRAARSRYHQTANDWTEGLVLNARRPLFSDVRLRRAVAYAVDRRGLAAAIGVSPTTHVLPPSFPGFDARPDFLLRPDLGAARALAGDRHVEAVFAAGTDAAGSLYDAGLVEALRRQLAAVHIRLNVLTWSQSDSPEKVASVLARADLTHVETNGDDALDPVLFFTGSRGYQYLPAADRTRLARLALLPYGRREVAAAAFAQTLERDAVYIAFGDRVTPELWSKRLGCIVRQPEYPGLDIAALCLPKG